MKGTLELDVYSETSLLIRDVTRRLKKKGFFNIRPETLKK